MRDSRGQVAPEFILSGAKNLIETTETAETTETTTRSRTGSNGSNGSNYGARPRYCVTFVTMAVMLQPTAVGYYNPECHSERSERCD